MKERITCGETRKEWPNLVGYIASGKSAVRRAHWRTMSQDQMWSLIAWYSRLNHDDDYVHHSREILQVINNNNYKSQSLATLWKMVLRIYPGHISFFFLNYVLRGLEKRERKRKESRNLLFGFYNEERMGEKGIEKERIDVLSCPFYLWKGYGKREMSYMRFLILQCHIFEKDNSGWVEGKTRPITA